MKIQQYYLLPIRVFMAFCSIVIVSCSPSEQSPPEDSSAEKVSTATVKPVSQLTDTSTPADFGNNTELVDKFKSGQESPDTVTPYEDSGFNNDVLTASFERRWTGDLDSMIARRSIRALVVYSRTSYFLDGVTARGIAYDSMQAFEKYLNQQLNNKTVKVHVVYIPVSTDQIIPALESGLGDIAVTNYTVTERRRQLVDFSRPVLKNVKEVLVTGKKAPAIASLEDLSGQIVHLRPSSSYYQSLLALNRRFIKEGREPVKLVKVSKYLEDDDLLEMVNAGMIGMTVVDDHIAAVWHKAFSEITVRHDIVVSEDNVIAWAFRKNSPQLEAMLNDFLRLNGKGTLFGNLVFQRYLQTGKYVKNPLRAQDIPKLKKSIALLQKYANQYGFDWTMIAAQAYQESRLDQSRRSEMGAIGIMQVLPRTAADRKVNIPHIEELENNIHAGIKYLRFVTDHYFSDEGIDDFNRIMLAFAAYNAGPAKVARLRQKARDQGLDPNIWFNNVELVVAKKIGNETVQYVSNILKYWLIYKLLRERQLIEAPPQFEGSVAQGPAVVSTSSQ